VGVGRSKLGSPTTCDGALGAHALSGLGGIGSAATIRAEKDRSVRYVICIFPVLYLPLFSKS
jgi:hypothetical protein